MDGDPKQYKVRMFALLSICETILFAGIPFGWGTMVYFLKEEGVYSHLCNPYKNSTLFDNQTDSAHNALTDAGKESGSTASCLEQDQQLNLWFSISIGVSTALNSVIGKTVQVIGATKTRIIFMPFLAGGLLCFAFTSKELPWLSLPGLLMLFVGGFSILVSNMRVASFLTVGSSVYIGLLCGSFDTSSIITTVIKVLHETCIDKTYTFVGMAILSLILSGVNTIMHAKFVSQQPEREKSSVSKHVNIKKYEMRNQSRKSLKNIEDSTAVFMIKHISNYNNSTDKHVKLQSIPIDENITHITNNNNSTDGHVRRQSIPIDEDITHITNNNNSTGAHVKRQSIPIGADTTVYKEPNNGSTTKHRSLKEHLTSKLLCIHTIFLSVLVLRVTFFLGSINKQLELIFNDKIKVANYTDVLAYTLMGGIVGSLISGAILEWQNRTHLSSDTISEKSRQMMSQVFPLSICSTLCVTLSALNFITSSKALYPLFVNVMLLRSFMYSVNMEFINTVFPREYTSVLFGIVITFCGAFSFLQYALFVWMNSYEGALLHINWVLLGLALLSLCYPLYVYYRGRNIY